MSLAVVAPGPDAERLIVRTRALQTVWQLLDRVAEDRTVGITIADPGFGKTYALGAWRRKNKERRYIWIEANICLSPGPVLDTLASALKIEHGRSLWRKTKLIAERLKDEPILIAIDEADLLTVRGFEVLRSIWDQVSELLGTDGTAAFPLVLLGTPVLLEKLAKPELERLHRRISEIAKLPPLNELELKAVLAAKWPALRYNDEGFTALLKLSRGSFGWLDKIVPVVSKLAAKDNGVVTARLAYSARKYLLGLPEGD